MHLINVDSIWPAGIDSEPQGTIEWAGGLINWNDSDYEAAGHFYTLIKSVSIQCADPASPNSTDTSYAYTTNVSTNTPGVTFSQADIVVNGAMGFASGRAAVLAGLLAAFGIALVL